MSFSQIKVFFLVIFMITNTKICISQNLSGTDLSIEYVNPFINTIIQIQCDSFRNAFGNQIKHKNISDSNIISAIKNQLRKIKYSNNHSSVDVRSKFYFHFDNQIYIICFNGLNGVLINNQSIKKNKKLNRLLMLCLNQ